MSRTLQVTRDFAGYYAPERVGATRRATPEGFLVLVDTPIARIGTQLYHASELPGVEPDSEGLIRVERPEEEVFDSLTLASFEGKDYVIEHPPKGIDTTNWKKHAVGHVQNVREGSGSTADLVLADIIVKDPAAIAYINKNLPDNSAGYNCGYEQVAPGCAIQRNIRGNHVAAVTVGRGGGRVAVRDHAMVTQNRAAMAGAGGRHRIGEPSKPVSIAELNAANREYWNKRSR
ncbi:MAG: putative phage head protein/prohead protease [Gammaproteobacteria bacterium]|nr:putative phage head protein/prohead protease [Gammaproteobacteria bacterium]